MEQGRVAPSTVAYVLVLIAAVGLTIYFLVDDTPAGWMIRLSWAGALTAGVAALLIALARLIEYGRQH